MTRVVAVLFIFFYLVTGVNKFLYDLLLSYNGIVDSWEIDKLDSLVEILMLTLSQQIGVAVVVVTYVGWCWC